MKIAKRIMCIILSCVLLIAGGAFDVFASGIIDPTKPCSLTVHYKYESTAIPNTGFDVYYIATVDENFNFTLKPAFAGHPIPSGPEVTQNDWNAYANSLKAFVQANGISADYHRYTDASGNFALTGLPSGMYFYFGEKHSMGGYTYVNQPGLISLPNLEDVISPDGTLNRKVVRDVTISPKVSRSKNPTPSPGGGGGGGQPKVMKKAMIRWKSDNPDERPDSITAHLLKDGVIYDTVQLTPGGDWRYTWYDLPAYDSNGNKIVWTVTIDPPEGYAVLNYEEGITTVLELSAGEEKTADTGGRLPQTGQLWWPVPVLLSLGLLLIIIGILRRRSEEA